MIRLIDDDLADAGYREYEEGRRDGFRNGVWATLAWVFLVGIFCAIALALWVGVNGTLLTHCGGR